MIIYGASGHGKVIAEILEVSGISGLVFVDDKPVGSTFLDYPLYHTRELVQLDSHALIIAVGNNKIRKAIVGRLNADFARAIHPSAQLSKRCQPGAGTVVMAGVAVNAATKVGRHVILNTNCSVDHDCELEDYVHISPGAALAGGVSVGEGTHIGIGASVIQGIRIGKWATIGAGAVVLKDVPDFAVVVGVPGMVIKYNPSD